MKKQWLEVKWFLRNILLGVLPLLFLTTLSLGEEMRIFVPSYEGEELAKVREWEKTWVGKRIDKTNVDQVKDFLLEPHVRIIKDPMYMNAKEYWFVIVPYQEAPYSKGQMEMTQKYAPAKFKGNDELVNYESIAGFPFPEPKTGLEVAYNYDAQTRGDSRWWYSKGSVVDPRTGFARDAEMYRMGMYWCGRCFTPPYPLLPKNPKGFRRTYFQRMFVPEDLKGMGNLEVKYNNPNVDDEKWTYMPNFRRITRTSQTQRGDQMGSGERLVDDLDGGWCDHVNRNTYKLLGRKELFVARHSDPHQVFNPPKSVVLNGIQRERVKTFEVEVHYKKKGYTYSKQLWYIDPELWIINTKMMWDEDGRLWRLHDEQWAPIKTVTGETAFTEASGFHWDVFGRGGQWSLDVERKDVGKNFPASKFTINALQKESY